MALRLAAIPVSKIYPVRSAEGTKVARDIAALNVIADELFSGIEAESDLTEITISVSVAIDPRLIV